MENVENVNEASGGAVTGIPSPVVMSSPPLIVFNFKLVEMLDQISPDTNVICYSPDMDYGQFDGVDEVFVHDAAMPQKSEDVYTKLNLKGCAIRIVRFKRQDLVSGFDPIDYVVDETAKNANKVQDANLKYIVDGKAVLGRGGIKWVIKDLLPLNATGFLYGSRGCYKSFLALNIVAAVLYGHDWHGLTNRIGKGRVLYVVAEGHGGFPARLHAMRQQYGDWDDGALMLIERHIDITDAVVLNSILQEAKHYENPFTLIVWDTIARVASGVDKNTDQMAKVIDHIDLFKTNKSTNIIVAHPPKGNSDTIYGNSVQEGAADFMLQVSRPKDTQYKVEVFVQKQKDGEDGQTYELELEKVMVHQATAPDDDDEFSLIVKESVATQKDLNSLGKILRQIHVMKMVAAAELSEALTKGGVAGCDKGNMSRKLTKDKPPAVMPEGAKKSDYCTNSIKMYVKAFEQKNGHTKVPVVMYSLNELGEKALVEMMAACSFCGDQKEHKTISDKEQDEIDNSL